MTKEPFIAHSELTNEIYIVVGKQKYRVTEQAIKAVMAIKALEQEPIYDELRAEITTLQNRCYALTKGTMCAFCKYECEYKAESEPQESEDKCKNCKYYLNPDYTRCHECKAESEADNG